MKKMIKKIRDVVGYKTYSEVMDLDYDIKWRLRAAKSLVECALVMKDKEMAKHHYMQAIELINEAYTKMDDFTKEA